jgi:nucleoid-associated protein YgaU
MTHRAGPIARCATSLLAVIALIGLVPLALLAVTRHRFGSSNPLAELPWPWQWSVGDASDVARSPLTDDAVVNLLVRSALVVTWVSIAVIVVTTALEVAHLVRHRGMAMPSIRGLGWAQPLARTLAAGLLVLVPLTTPKASLEASGPPRAAAALAVVDIGTNTAPSRPTTSPEDSGADASVSRSNTRIRQTPRLHIVQRSESVYGISEALAGDVSMTTAEIADRILDTNLGNAMVGGQHFTNPAYIEIGWELVIPADVLPVTRATPSTPNIPPTPPGNEIVNNGATQHLVVPGDTLSGIAEQHLGDADAWPTVFDENVGREMGDGRTFTDPHLIVPGWTIDIPHVNTGTSARSEAEDEEVSADQPDAHIDQDAPTAELAPTTPEPVTTDAATPRGTDSSTTSTTSTLPALPPDTPSPAAPGASSAPSAPAPIRIEHAALLAAGVLVLVGVRRRQRLRSASPRARVPEPPAAVMATERRLRTVDPGERSTRVDVAIRAVAHELVDTDVQIGTMLLSPDGAIELRLTASAHLAPPWQPIGDTEQSWQLPASVPVEILGEAARRVGTPCVALVQIGVAGDRDVLIDVEACGTLSVAAAPEQADEVVTAIAAGLATSPYAEVAHLITVSLAAAAVLGHRNAHHAESLSAAIELATALLGPARPDGRSTFSLRSLRTGGEMWEPAVVLVSTGDQRRAEELPSPLPQAGRGVGLVIATGIGELVEAPSRLAGRSDGWTLSAFGQTLDLTPVGVSAAELADVADMIDDATAPLITADPVWANDHSESTAQLAADVTRDVFEPRRHEIVVRLMGGVEVVSSDGRPGLFERSKTVELLAWLATHRESSTRTAARTALWQLDVRDATFANVVSEARRALGRLVTPPGDDEWVARTLTERLPLHEGVVTDAELMDERLQAARLQAPAHAVETLRPAAELIRDIPFAGTSYLWPDAEGITSNLVLLATGIAAELAGHALSLGNTDLVFWATGQGLKVLAGHEELIGLRMRAHARAGDLAGVRQEWESYERVIVADAWSDGEPAPKLLALRRELLATST